MLKEAAENVNGVEAFDLKACHNLHFKILYFFTLVTTVTKDRREFPLRIFKY